MKNKRFILNAGRTTKQGQQINVGKDSPEYQAIVSTMIMHPEDMKEAGIAPGQSVRVRSETGEATFQCKEGKVPQGMIFVPYGPPTCRIMGRDTDGTGMPTSKGWEVELEPIPGETTNSA
jgi:formylmethanofuran dehydrogenase subunit D